MMKMKTRVPAAAILIAGMWLAAAAGRAQQEAIHPAAEPSAREELLDAYKKEFAFLESERESLRKRLREAESGRVNKTSRLKGDIAGLEDRLLSLSRKADDLQEELGQTEEKTARVAETEENLLATVNQAQLTLDKHGIELPKTEGENGLTQTDKEKLVNFIFDQGVGTLGKVSGVHAESGSFFLENGMKSDGRIVWVGQVGAYGLSSKGSGVLAPAGGGELKLWNETTAAAASDLADNRLPRVLGLYLFDSLDKAAESVEESFSEHIESGGFIAYIIIALGAAGLLMVLVRTFFLWRSASNTPKLVSNITPLLQKGKAEEALELCHSGKGAAARVLAATIRHLDSDPAHLEDVISESILHETPFLERFEQAITVFAAVAPLLGLLGTVTGMIAIFDVITVYGTGDPKLLSGGISEALVTTELGLMISIPLLLMGHLLSGWSERILAGMENAALRITNVAKGFKPEQLSMKLD